MNGKERDRIDCIDRKVATLIQKTDDMHDDIREIKTGFNDHTEKCDVRMGRMEVRMAKASGVIGAISIIAIILAILKTIGLI